MPASERIQDRRGLYRTTVGQDNQVEVAIWTDSGDGLVGEVMDVSAQGVAIRVSRNSAPVLSLGENVAFPFTPRSQTEPVALRATVRSRNLLDKYWRYGFEFQLKCTLNMRFAEEFYGLFNRRNAFRVKPLPDESISVNITGLDASVPSIATAKLNDVSATGLSVLIPLTIDPTLAKNATLRTALRPPTSSRALKLAGRIRHRTAHNSTVCYGLQFEPAQCEQFEQDHEELVDYIIHRQLEDLADYAGPSLTQPPLQPSEAPTKTPYVDQARTA